MSLTLVVGATGTVGSSVVRELVQRGERVRALTSKTPRGGADGVEWAQADLATGAGIERAFDGVRRAFLFAPPGYTRQHELLVPLIRRAKAQRLDKVVLMTALGADADPEAPLRIAEIELENAGLAYDIVRPNWFMQNFNHAWLPAMLATGRIQVPAGRAKTSFIDTRDIAAVAARLLTSHDVDDQAFDLTGPRALDHDEVAAVLARASGKPIRYENVEPQVLRQQLLGAGLDADYVEFLLLILGFLAAGYNERTTDSVQRLLGRAPIDFERYAHDHREAWAAVPGA